jgi:His/Glu/Gln/Arg/opine family amino acid ABC transporter permease subunit
MEYSFSWSTLIEHYLPILRGIKDTFLISGAIIGLAMTQGLFLCLARLSGSRIFGSLAVLWVEAFRNIPRIVLLLWAYYCTSIYLKMEFVTPWMAAIAALSLQEGALQNF